MKFKNVFLTLFLTSFFIQCQIKSPEISEILIPSTENNKIEKKEEKNPKGKEFDDVVIPEKLLYYYQGIDFNKNGKSLYDDLAVLTITKHREILAYDSKRHRTLRVADADIRDKNKIVLIYTGEKRNIEYIKNLGNIVDTEHVYPQSLLKKSSNMKKPESLGDLHHLRYCDPSVNRSRSNRAFTYGEGKCKKVGKFWYPGDEWKGDIARMIFYLNLRYNAPFDLVSTDGVKLFLKWNAEDPVSDLETQRNNEIEKRQGNRNPFVDNPYLVTKIWKGAPAKNFWKRRTNLKSVADCFVRRGTFLISL